MVAPTDHGVEVRDVVVLQEFDGHDHVVALWPPMQVLQKGPVRRGGKQSLFLRHSKRLTPLPADEQRVTAALRGLQDDEWITGARRRRLLDLWELTEPSASPVRGRSVGRRS